MLPDAAGGGKLAILRFFSTNENPLPILLDAHADDKLRGMATKSNKIYISGLLAVVATVSQPRDE